MWKVLSIDDDLSVNKVAQLLLRDLSFMDQEIVVLSTSSFDEAQQIVQDQSDVAVILMDVMMKSESSGLNFINCIRNKLNNREVRIILRTGYPDSLPERRVIRDYEIDGYFPKDLSSEVQMEVAIMTAIRSYNQIITTTKLLKSLAGSIAHEVRNPLNAIFGLSSQIDNLYEDNKELKDLTGSIRSSIDRTNQIIDMTLSDLRGEEIDKSKFKLLNANKVINKAIKEYGFTKEGARKVIFINGEEEGSNFTFKGDETMFIYIIFNIVKNALYYLTQYPESKITIINKLSTQQGDDNYNQIIVRDTGPGIAKDKLETIFGSFETSGKEGGTGLGLPFCRRVMTAFEGSIICESELGEYTEFIMSFPILSVEEIKNFNQNLRNLPKRKVLIVDDQDINLKISKDIIEGGLANISCILARDGKEAVEIAKKEKPDFVFMDLQMPIMDGFEATKEIKIINKGIPIIAHTSQRSQEYRNKAKEVGIDHYITKPASHNILLRTVTKWFLNQHNFTLSKEEVGDVLKNKRIISADDNKLNNMILSTELRRQFNMQVDEVETGEELLEKYHNAIKQKTPYDAILTDIKMSPGISGIELSKRIRKFEIDNNIKYRTPIIAITGDDDKESVHTFFRNGIDDINKKGGNRKVLPDIIAFWITERTNKLKHIHQNNDNIRNEISKGDIDQSSRIDEEEQSNNQSKILNLKESKYQHIPLIKEPVYFNNEIIELFLSSVKDLINNIKEFNAKRDLDALHIKIHALKGVTGNFGSRRLYQIIVDLDSDNYFFSKEMEMELDLIWSQTERVLRNRK